MNWRLMFQKITLAVFISVALSSCGAMVFVGGAAAGAGVYQYIRGQMQSVENASVEETYRAGVLAFKRLRIPLNDGEYDAFKGFLIADRADGARIEVRLNSKQINRTEVTVRIGIFGDEHDSRVILDAIHKEVER